MLMFAVAKGLWICLVVKVLQRPGRWTINLWIWRCCVFRTPCTNLDTFCLLLKVNFYGTVVPAGMRWLQGDTFGLVCQCDPWGLKRETKNYNFDFE